MLVSRTNDFANPKPAFTYSVNKDGQRESVAMTGSQFAANSGWAWDYNSSGELTGANHTGSSNTPNRAYEYDGLGNRTKSSDGATEPPPSSTPPAP